MQLLPYIDFLNLRGSLRRGNFVARGGYNEIMRVAYPLIIMSAGSSVMQFVDRWFLAKNSTLDVAAALPGGILNFTLCAIFISMCNFSSALVAQFHGANRRDKLLESVWAGQFVALFCAIFIMTVNPFIGRAVIHWGGHSAALVEREMAYFNSLLPFGAFICCSAPFFAFFSGQGRTVPVAVINIIGCLLNVGLDYALIFGNCGFPRMGIEGAGIATSISGGCTLAIVAVFFFCQKQSYIPTRRLWRFRPELIIKLFRYGLPSGFQTFADVGAFTLLVFLIGGYGEAALAASVIALAVNNIFFVPLLGLSDSTAIVVGQYIGQKLPNVAERTALRAWRLAALYSFLGFLVYVCFPEFLCGIFYPREAVETVNFAEVVKIARGVLLAAGMFVVTDSIKYVFMGALRGAGDTLMVFLINSFTAWGILLPGSFMLAKVHMVSIYVVWGFVAGVGMLDAGLFLWRFYSGRWRRIDLIGSGGSDPSGR